LQKSRNAKPWVAQKLLEMSFIPFCFVCETLVDLCGTPLKCKVLGLSALNHFTSCFAILILCAIVQTLTLKEQVFCSNGYKQALTIENEKSEAFK
jgi:hypothetical protein